MVEQKLVFERYNPKIGEVERLPITEDVLRDPQYTRWVLPAIMEYGLPDLRIDKRMKDQLTRTALALSRLDRRWWEHRSEPTRSVLDLVAMSDQKLLDSHAKWLGPKRIAYFREAWKNFRALRTST